MSRDLMDYTGKAFGSWTVLGRAQWSLNGTSTSHLTCECGDVAVKAGTELNGLSKCPECQAWNAKHEEDTE